MSDDKIVEIAPQDNLLAIRISSGLCFWITPPLYRGDEAKIKKIDRDVIR